MNSRVLLLCSLLIAVMLGCSRDMETPVETDQGAAPGVSRPDAPVLIVPEQPTTRDAISLRAGMDLSGAQVRWMVNDGLREDLQGLQLPAGTLGKGDRVQAIIVKDNKEFLSNSLTILNTPPTIQRARLEPEFPRAGAAMRMMVSAEDPDGDYVYYRYQWYVNDQLLGDRSEYEGDLRRGDSIVVEVTANDGNYDGTTVQLKSKVVNSPPVVAQGTDSFNGTVYTYAMSASDPDGDSLTYELLTGPDGAVIDPKTGLITWSAGPQITGKFPLQVAVSDGNGGKTTFGIEVSLGAQPSP